MASRWDCEQAHGLGRVWESQQQGITVWALCSGLEGLILETSPCGWGWRPCWDTSRSVRSPGVGSCKGKLLLLHWCVLPGQCQAAASGSGVMLAPVEPLCPWLPGEMIPVQGHTGQEVAPLFVIVPGVLLRCHSLAWVTGVQCQVIGISTVLLQPNSLLQNPFSSPVPYQVWFFPRNECMEGGSMDRLEPAGRVSQTLEGG